MQELERNRALVLATLAFAANFSVWTLYAAIVLPIASMWHLSVTEIGVLLAAPMLTGAILRIPVGLLVDCMSAKLLFVLQMLLCIPALLLLYVASNYNYLLMIGLWIGISGCSFTIGIRYVCDFFPRKQQGTAMGVFGVGNSGAAITLVFAPWLIENYGWQWVGPAYALGLAIIAVMFWLLAPRQPVLSEQIYQPPQRWQQLLKNHHIWRLGLYYYFVFGSFLALLLWLPYYYMQAYQLSLTQAMAFTLFFVATSSVIRALGGWFADKYGGRSVNWSVFWVCLVCLFFLSYPSTTMTIHGVEQDVDLTISVNVWVFTALLFIIGLAQGFGRASVFKMIHEHYPQQMGAVGGIVAAVGALGGFTLPILFSYAVDFVGFYSASFMMLYGVLAACMMVMYFALKAQRYQRRLKEASSYNFLEDDDL